MTPEPAPHYLLGAKAAFEGLGPWQNPHESGDPANREWDRGHRAAREAIRNGAEPMTRQMVARPMLIDQHPRPFTRHTQPAPEPLPTLPLAPTFGDVASGLLGVAVLFGIFWAVPWAVAFARAVFGPSVGP